MRMKVVADEAAVALRQPVGESTAAVAPEDVVAAVAVVVAGLHDLPAIGQDCPAVGVIADEAAVGLGEPGRERAVVPAPDEIIAVVAVEVAGALDAPAVRNVSAPGIDVVAGEAAIGLASQLVKVPSLRRQAMSSRPSPLKSPVAATCQLVGSTFQLFASLLTKPPSL